MTEEIEVIPQNLLASRTGAQHIEKATEMANALAKVIEDQKLYSLINNRKFTRLEGWTLLGSMMGVFPVTEWTRPVEEDGKRIGWEARVTVQTRSGEVIGAAESMCTTLERNWKGRDEFAVRSMAATRAASKALRLPLGFVMVLAGFEAAPEEEVDTAVVKKTAKSIPPQAPKETPKVEKPPAQGEGEPEAGAPSKGPRSPVLQANKIRLLKLAGDVGMNEDELQALVEKTYNCQIDALDVEQLKSLCDDLQKAKK